jgi:hypothetical protein
MRSASLLESRISDARTRRLYHEKQLATEEAAARAAPTQHRKAKRLMRLTYALDDLASEGAQIDLSCSSETVARLSFSVFARRRDVLSLRAAVSEMRAKIGRTREESLECRETEACDRLFAGKALVEALEGRVRTEQTLQERLNAEAAALEASAGAGGGETVALETRLVRAEAARGTRT